MLIKLVNINFRYMLLYLISLPLCLILMDTMDTRKAVCRASLLQKHSKHLSSASDSYVNISVVQDEVNFAVVSV